MADWELLGQSIFDRAQAALRGGLRWICLRAKGLGDSECLRVARELRAACPDAILSINGSVAAAEALGTGAHLPSRGPSVASVRARLPGALLGASCHGREELLSAWSQGADYALLSPVFATISKAPAGGELGGAGFAAAREGVGFPVLALGGVTPERVAEAAAAGASGVAVLGALFLAPDVEERARQFVRRAQEVFHRG
ncbi:MAG: thiamine phosphate synthase [Deltaproteobacteria bacterium]|nr:thiamine phosphate synthase [Deltaproteobacteria bacterium]